MFSGAMTEDPHEKDSQARGRFVHQPPPPTPGFCTLNEGPYLTLRCFPFVSGKSGKEKIERVKIKADSHLAFLWRTQALPGCPIDPRKSSHSKQNFGQSTCVLCNEAAAMVGFAYM